MNRITFKGSTFRHVEKPSRQLAGGSEGNDEKHQIARVRPGRGSNLVWPEITLALNKQIGTTTSLVHLLTARCGLAVAKPSHEIIKSWQ
jgi:hypothetical protein